ncbi:MAG TPA: isochorismatase family cysteine hydrolase [Chloroflexota bacterium]|jgi:ureidoacrylate peracid hydrolase|nr:isochorismatase family cysteine hydrolase [Chloroflexota bacterium]
MDALAIDELVEPKQAALLVVDMQNDFCDAQGSLALSGSDPSMIQAMAPRLLRLLDAARKAGLPIIHIRTHHSQWTDSQAWLGRLRGRRPVCVPGTWGADYYPGFEPVDSEYVVTKHRYSGFLSTDLEQVLRAIGARSVILTGEATNVCVESTARDAYMRDFYIAFVSDCTASTVESAHEATLFTMNKHFGKVLTSDEIIEVWARVRQPVAV